MIIVGPWKGSGKIFNMNAIINQYVLVGEKTYIGIDSEIWELKKASGSNWRSEVDESFFLYRVL